MIKFNFSDMHRDFDPKNNIITEIISKNFDEWSISDEPDFLFFSCSGTNHYKYDNIVKIFVTGEPVYADFNICDYAIAFPHMECGGKYLKRPAWFTHIPPKRIEEDNITDEQLLNRKFCNFVYSNATRGTAVEFRQMFAKRLMRYKHIDCPGKVLNNMPEGSISPRRCNERPGKIEFVKNYKFTIAFENCQIPGYSSEKIEDPLIAHSIPIYWGDPDVKKLYNANSYICVNGRETDIESVIDEIIYLDTHDDEYLKMVKTYPVIGSYEQDIDKVEDFIVNIIKRGNNILHRDPLNFGRVMTIPDYRTKELLSMLGKKVEDKWKSIW